MHYGLWQKHQRMDLFARSLALRGVMGFVAFSTVLVLLGGNVIHALASLSCTGGVVWLIHDRIIGNRNVKEGPNFGSNLKGSGIDRTFKLIRLALPLTIVAFLGALITNIPRYLIEGYLGLEALGIFASIAYIVTLGMLVVNSAGQAMLSQLSTSIQELDHTGFRRLLTILLMVGIVLGVCGTGVAWFLGEEILVLIYGESFSPYADLFILLMIAGTAAYIVSCLNFAAIAQRQFTQLLGPFSLGCLSVLVCSYFLINEIGLTGVAIAIGVTSVIVGVYLFIIIFIYLRKAELQLLNLED